MVSLALTYSVILAISFFSVSLKGFKPVVSPCRDTV